MTEPWVCPRCTATVIGLSYVCTSCGFSRADVAHESSPAQGLAEQQPPVEPAAAVSADVQALAPAGSGTPAADTPAADTPAGWVGPTLATATRSPGRRRRIPVGWAIIVTIVVGGAALSAFFAAGRSGSGEIVRAGNVDAVDLRVGDCFDLKDPASDEVGDVDAVPCNTAHEFETIHTGALPDGDFPGAEAFRAYVDEHCLAAFEAYVGTEYEESALEVYWLEPSTESWRDGDRTIQCAAYHPRVHRLTASLKGSEQ